MSNAKVPVDLDVFFENEHYILAKSKDTGTRCWIPLSVAVKIGGTWHVEQQFAITRELIK